MAHAHGVDGNRPDLKGGCLCGAVRYRTLAEPQFQGFCYCRDCRRSSGTGRVPYMGFERSKVEITGETLAFSVTGDSGGATARHFCPRCGSRLFSAPSIIPDILIVYAGTLDRSENFTPETATFMRSRVPWEPVPLDLTRHDRDVDDLS